MPGRASSLFRALLLGGSLAGLVAAQGEEGPALSPRNANYTIEVALDPATKLLEGHQIVEWTNLQSKPTRRLWFHLYWNAWRNDRSTWMLEDRLRGRSDHEGAVAEGDWAFLDVEAIRLLPSGVDLRRRIRFAAPDDGNPDDRTVLVLHLPEPVQPGGTVRVQLDWRAKVPRTFARTGFRGDYYFIAHWFPKLGVYEADGWNCHQYHAGTEYYSDYGIYDVSITLPSDYVLGATGRLADRRDNTDGTSTHRYVEEDVHAFTWTASPDYVVVEERFEAAGLPPVDIRLLMQPEHVHQTSRHLAATKAALESYGSWYGPYPYGHLTVVDPAYGSGAGGMEYPTLFTCGTRLFNPFGGGSPERVTIHEAGHQFWYGIVGNNEFEHAWLDEGLNTFSTARVYAETYGRRQAVHRFFAPPGTRQRGFLPVLLPGFSYAGSPLAARVGRFRPDATSDNQSTPTFLYHPASGGSLSYSKTALWLGTLENWLGWETLREILSTFFERWKFGHPEPEDFFAVAEEVAGQDLNWFFRQVLGSDAFDYAIQSVSSEPARLEGLVEVDGEMVHRGGEAKGASGTLYRTEVVVRRNGGAYFPVDVLLVFEDGEEIRHRWQGRGRWKLFVEERPARLEYALVDPERILLLDLHPSNNSRLLEPAATFPAFKWASRWAVWFQDFLTTFGFFV